MTTCFSTDSHKDATGTAVDVIAIQMWCCNKKNRYLKRMDSLLAKSSSGRNSSAQEKRCESGYLLHDVRNLSCSPRWLLTSWSITILVPNLCSSAWSIDYVSCFVSRVLIRTLDNSCTNGKQTISDVDRWHAVNSNSHTSWISMEENGVCIDLYERTGIKD